MNRLVEDKVRAYEMGVEANNAIQNVAAYNQALDILQQSIQLDLPLPSVVEHMKNRANRTVMNRARATGMYHYIDPVTGAPYNAMHGRLSLAHSIYPDDPLVAPELKVTSHMKEIVTYEEDGLRHGSLSKRTVTDKMLERAMQLADNAYERKQSSFAAKFSIMLERYAEYPEEREILSLLDKGESL